MGNVSKTVGFLGLSPLLLLYASFAAPFSSGDELLSTEKPILKLQGQDPQPAKGRPKNTTEQRWQGGTQPARVPTPTESATAQSGVYRGFSVLLATPFLHDSIYEAPFSSLGVQGLISLPLTQIGDGPHGLAVETGVSVVYSRLRLTQPSVEFTHLTLAIPARVRAVFATGNFQWELFAGVMIEAVELNSRPSPDGGLNANFRLVLDGGAGVSYPLFSETTRLRVLAGYYNVAIGAEWSL